MPRRTPGPDISSPGILADRLFDCRVQTTALTAGLTDADATVQSMEDASPTKWHLAHTTWFFEEFVLAPYAPGYRPVNAQYRYLFTSYYDAVGPRHPRPLRGLLSRPTLAEIVDYRQRIDDALRGLLAGSPPQPALALIELGIQHEQQHQELLLTDLLHLFAQNPLRPVHHGRCDADCADTAPELNWIGFPGGHYDVGHAGPGFAFDCERPRHAVVLAPYMLANRPVTNQEWIEFIVDGGYRTPHLWLSDGWGRVEAEHWQAPLYWDQRDGTWWQMTLSGECAVEPGAPVSQISYFEADAYARWAGARLPTEFEWEVAARAQPVTGQFASTGRLRPSPVRRDVQAPLRQVYGDVWEWTASAYSAYPGFKVAAGAVGEYNGKFMCSQYVLRGGSCATPAGHVRPTYRNFFYPHQRWQFAGLRLARDRT
jgi:ergothioneine biosynthesis protein EgtB